MHFSHNDALVVTVHINCCRVSKILVEGGSVNITYDHALDRIEDTFKLARKLIIPQTQLLLYGFDGSEAYSPDTVEFPTLADPFNVVTEFCVFDVQSPYNTIFGRPCIHIMRVVPSTHHQLLKHPTPSGMTKIRVTRRWLEQ